MRVGISVITHAGQSIWENGMGQNVVFLAQLLRRIDFVEQVVLVDVGAMGVMAPQVDLAELGLNLIKHREATDAIDIVIELAGALPAPWLAHFRACGGRAVYLCVGQPHAGLAEPILFGEGAEYPVPDRCDEVWHLPKDRDFEPMLRTMHRCPVHEVPYIWSPQFLAARAAEVERAGYRFGYRSGQRAWRVAIFEPNISVVKSCMLPMLICDVAHRQQPHAIASMQVLNAIHMREHPTLLYLANSLELVRGHKAAFHGRHDFAGFMVQHADAVVAHQWHNEQNYSYLDALYGGYPLIHNSPWLRDAGYYYRGFDVDEGAAQLLRALREHDAQLVDYRARSASLFEQLDPLADANIDGYAQRLLNLVGGRREFRAGRRL